MSKKEFPARGHCLSTNPIIVNYLKDNFEKFLDSKYSTKAIGVAWNKERWWYLTKQSSTPEYSQLVIMGIITEINEMKNFPLTGTLSTSSGITLSNVICDITTTNTTTTVKSLVTEPLKLRIKCQNLKKNLKVSLLQINLK